MQDIQRKLGMQVTQQEQVRQSAPAGRGPREPVDAHAGQQRAQRYRHRGPDAVHALLPVHAGGGISGRDLHRYLPFRETTMTELSDSLRNNVNANVLGQVLSGDGAGPARRALTTVDVWGARPVVLGRLSAFFVAFICVLGTPAGVGAGGALPVRAGLSAESHWYSASRPAAGYYIRTCCASSGWSCAIQATRSNPLC
ncbi:MAG: hypothetical protein WKG07_10385 [Hymenobacter sp.]